jgi:hypothetical protein
MDGLLQVASRYRWVVVASRGLLHQLAKAFAILGDVNRIDTGANDRSAGRFQCLGEVERRLAAELHDDALWGA